MIDRHAIYLLREVIDYYHGLGKYDFSSTESSQRDNQAFDSWQVLKTEIESFLEYVEEKEIPSGK